MTTKIATSFGLALMLAMGILATMLVLGVFTPSEVSAELGDRPAQTAVPAEAGGALAEYRFTFTVTGSMSPSVGEIRITFDKDTQMPATISRSNVLISATRLSKGADGTGIGVTGAGQFVVLDTDPVIENDITDSRRKVVKIKVPDMNPQNTVSPGIGIQGIGVGFTGTGFSNGGQGSEVLGGSVTWLSVMSEVTVVFTTAAGIKTPNAAEISGAKIEALDTTLWPSSTNLVSGAGTLAAPAPFSQTGLTQGNVQTPFKRTLRLSGTEGGRGTSLTLTGKGFTAGQTATIWRDANFDGTRDGTETDLANVVVGTDGSFVTTIVFNRPPFETSTTNNFINAIDGRGNTICAKDVVTAQGGCRSSTNADNELGNVKADLPTFKLTGRVSVTPTTAAVGDTIQIKVEDFASDVTLTSGLTGTGGVSLAGVGVAVPSGTKTTNGEVTFEATIPNAVPTGVQSLVVLEGTSSRRASITITGAVITLTPTTVVPNQTVTLIGRGFTGSSTINDASDASSITIGGNTDDLKAASTTAKVTRTAGTATKSEKFNESAKVTVDAGGNWSAALVVPINSTTTTAGTHELKVKDTGGRDGVVILVLAPRTLVLDPVSSRLGTTVKFSGDGYPADNTKSGSESTPAVSIRYSVGGTTRTVATVTPDASGKISGTFTVPLDAGIPSTNAVRAEYAKPGSTTTDVTTSAVHDVPRAVLTVSPTSGPSGTTVTITGEGYKAFSTVTELKLGDIDVRPAPVPATDGVGKFTATALVPQLNLGVHTVNAKVADTVASTSFTVGAAPPPPPPPAPVTTVAPATGLAPLGTNLVRTWGYDAATQKFQLYDPAAALLSDLAALKRGNGYWINVKSAQTVTLGTGSYSLSAGWNLIGWLG